MADTTAEHRRHLDPRTLAKISSLELRARLIVEGLMTGAHRSPYQGISVEFAQHRPYVAGDDIRHVDWKVLARNDKVYLKQYQEETNLQLILVVDASESMGFGSVEVDGRTWTKFDHATSIATSLAYLATHQADSVGLAIFDQTLSRYFKPSSAPAQWKLIANELQQVPKWNKTTIGKVLDQIAEKVTHRSVIVLLSDCFDDLAGIKKGLRHLRYRKHEVILLQVLDPQEIEFPFEDVTLFKGLEELGQLLTEPRALRDGYLEQMRLFTDELKKLCRGMNIDLTRFATSEPLDVSLSQFLANRAAVAR
ncbi:MAG TPA: DUF58 domain-containing protein [Tepidisphaeraceae bacterium]|jgi:uncharacterized protein (DUF58 family)